MTLTLKSCNPYFCYDTLVFDDISPYQVGYKTFSGSKHIVWTNINQKM